MKGKLVFLFGIDGSGKTTILKMLAEKEITNIVCTSCLENAIFEEELYQAEHRLHFSRGDYFSHEFKHVLHIGSVIYNMYNKIFPLLDNGTNVLLDRYVVCIKLFADLFLDPSFHCLSESLNCLPTPDLGIYFDIDIETALHRIHERSIHTGRPIHYSESKKSLIMKKTAYETRIPKENYPILSVDAGQSKDKVCCAVLEILQKINIV